jgi:hypothetical protein
MNIDLQLIALALACAGVLVTVYRRARQTTRSSLSPAEAYYFMCGSTILSIVLVAAAVIILAGCSPYVTVPNQTPTEPPTARLAITQTTQSKPTEIAVQTPCLTCTVRTGIPAGTVNLLTGAGVTIAHGLEMVR